jgi:hypothetical protein
MDRGPPTWTGTHRGAMEGVRDGKRVTMTSELLHIVNGRR